MWTNVFRIGELQTVSWFQFFPCENDTISLSDKSLKAEQKDTANYSILSAHLKLQNEGFLSTWTNSFVGPWDPSQGVHNPDEKIKLWLFLPGRHFTITEAAQSAVSRLRVVGSGLWIAPGDSEEVGVALSQALRNSIERSIRGLSYVRFGDVFTRCHPLTSSIRRLQPTIEFVFAANEDAIYVHAIVSAKHVRGLINTDMEKLLWHFSSHSVGDGIPVIVAPNGMKGRLTGCCPDDLVKQVYSSKLKASNAGASGVSFPSTHHSNFQSKGQSCYVEVTLGCHSRNDSNVIDLDNAKDKNAPRLPYEDPHLVSIGRSQQKQGVDDPSTFLERTFIYPAEAVVIPMMHKAFARSSSKSLAVGRAFNVDPSSGLGIGYSSMKLQKQYNSSSNSVTSSISSISRTSSDSHMAVEAGDLEADADSLTCGQSGLSSKDQVEKDDNEMVSKRPRTGTTGKSVQAGKTVGANIHDTYMSEHSGQANNFAAAGGQNAQVVSFWDWDDDDRGIGMDIQTLLSEFGDFGDFFEDDDLTFGEPPGTAESQALMFPSADFEDVTGSPCTGGIEIPEQKLVSVGLASLDDFSQQTASLTEDYENRSIEGLKESTSILAVSAAPLSHEFDHLTKAEAMMTFATEYAPVDASTSDLSPSIFKSPYFPRSRKVESSGSSSNSYVYSAIPPSSSVDTSEDQSESSTRHKLNALGHGIVSSVQSSNLYTHIKSGGEKKSKRAIDNNVAYCNGEEPYSASDAKSLGIATTHQKKIDILEPGSSLLPLRTVLATDIECIMFQAAMCRVRHTILSHTNKVSLGLTSSMSEVTNDSNIKSDTLAVKYEARKRENIPVRIAGDFDSGLQDGSLAATVGVWRSVGAPKATKPSRTSDLSPISHNNLSDETLNIQGHRQPLQDLLDALGFLVQQSTSFVDISLDSTDSNGSYYWLGLQEQKRRELACGPSMMHAGCGGLLSTCHSLDIAGVDLINPLSTDVQVSSVISLLHSDVKVSLKSAFPSVDGPISVTDWCKGRSHSGDPGSTGGTNEAKDSSSMTSLVGEPISPTQPAGLSASSREGAEEQQRSYPRLRPTIMVVPLPAILVGYQDDWLKTSVNSLQLWEKAPLEPYALPKPVSYFALCPDIDLLTSASVDFFQQLGTVYEMCKLGSHSPQICGGQMESSPGTCLPSGLLLIDCPQQMKISANHLNAVGTLTDYFVALSKGWNVKDFVKALVRLIRGLNLSSSSSVNQKEGSSGPCTVLYVICPFPEPKAVLQTLVECSVALGSLLTVDKEKRAMLHSHVAKALSCTTSVDEALTSNVLMLSGFTVNKLVLQIITIEMLLKANRPISELSTLRDIAFTVYNKARRIPRTASNFDLLQSSPLAARSTLMHMSSPMPGLWKDCLAPRISGPSISREGELDAALRPASWESSWQTPRIGGLGSDQNRYVDGCGQDDTRYMFEPFFILAEPGSVEHGTSAFGTAGTFSETSSSRPVDDTSGMYMQSSTTGGATDTGGSSVPDSLDHDNKTPSLHCSYGWTEDWRWLVCLWTDSRGELLDSCIFPFGGISSQQDSKVLQNLFVQILQQGCQILSCASSDGNPIKPRDVIITRLGCFFELECQEWQKAFYSFGGNDVKKWPLQLRRAIPDGMTTNTNGNSLQQHDLSLIQERTLPSSPSPLYSPHSKANFGKGGLGQVNSKKPLVTGQAVVDNTRGLLQMVQSISLIGVSVDHSLHLMLQADMSSVGGTQGNCSSSSPSYLEGFSPLKSVGSMQASYLFIPSPSTRYLSSTPLQLPTFLTSESPPLAHLLHSKGSAIPLATGYVVSKAVPAMRQTTGDSPREDWPSVLSVSLIEHYGSNNTAIQERVIRSGGTTSSGKQVRNVSSEVPNKDYEAECRAVLESVAAELHSLSWMTTSPVFPERRSALPFHCEMILRLRRLLHFADKELSRPPENIQHA